MRNKRLFFIFLISQLIGLSSCCTTSGWKSACSGIVAHPSISGTSIGSDGHQYLVVKYIVDPSGVDWLFNSASFETAYAALLFDKQQVPDQFRYDGPRQSNDVLMANISSIRQKEISDYRFETKDWILGKQLAKSPNFKPVNEESASVYSSEQLSPKLQPSGIGIIPYWKKSPLKKTNSMNWSDYFNNRPRDLLCDSEKLSPDFDLLLLPCKQPRLQNDRYKAIGMAIVKTLFNFAEDCIAIPVGGTVLATYYLLMML